MIDLLGALTELILCVIFADLRGVFSPPLMITDHSTAELSVTGNDRSIEYYFASDAR